MPGVNTTAYQVLASALSASFAGLAGRFYPHYITNTVPDTAFAIGLSIGDWTVGDRAFADRTHACILVRHVRGRACGLPPVRAVVHEGDGSTVRVRGARPCRKLVGGAPAHGS